eukprot:5054915-Prymnesium_polylepis.2
MYAFIHAGRHAFNCSLAGPRAGTDIGEGQVNGRRALEGLSQSTVRECMSSNHTKGETALLRTVQYRSCVHGTAVRVRLGLRSTPDDFSLQLHDQRRDRRRERLCVRARSNSRVTHALPS